MNELRRVAYIVTIHPSRNYHVSFGLEILTVVTLYNRIQSKLIEKYIMLRQLPSSIRFINVLCVSVLINNCAVIGFSFVFVALCKHTQ